MYSRVSGNAEASQSGYTSVSGAQTPHAERSPGRPPSSTLDPRLQGLTRLRSVAELGLRDIPWPARGGMAPPSSQPPLLVSDGPVAVARPPAPQAVRSSGKASSSRLTSRAVRRLVTQARNPLNLRHDEIAKIGKTRGGRTTLAYIESYGQALTQPPFDYSKNDIVKIAANHGGCQALQTVHEIDHTLRTLGYSKDDIVRIAAHDGGSKAMQTMPDLDNTLRALGYSKDDIVRIAANIGGSQALQTLHDLDHALHALGYTNNDIVRIAAHDGGSPALHTVHDLDNSLRGLGYTNNDIVRIAAHVGGSQALQMVHNVHHALCRLSYTKDDIVNTAANGGGTQALRALQEHHDTLVTRGLTKHDIMNLASQRRGASSALKRAAGES
jgi:hypothetical protein